MSAKVAHSELSYPRMWSNKTVMMREKMPPLPTPPRPRRTECVTLNAQSSVFWCVYFKKHAKRNRPQVCTTIQRKGRATQPQPLLLCVVCLAVCLAGWLAVWLCVCCVCCVCCGVCLWYAVCEVCVLLHTHYCGCLATASTPYPRPPALPKTTPNPLQATALCSPKSPQKNAKQDWVGFSVHFFLIFGGRM